MLVLIALGALPSHAQVEELHKNCGALSQPGHYPDYEPTPVYSIERRDYTATKPQVLVLQISIPTEAFGGAAIIRLACKLVSDFQQENVVKALIFDDKKAARNLALGVTDQTHRGAYLWHLKGRFELDREKGLQFVEFVVPEVKDEMLNLKRIRISVSSATAK
jgi:hypothetical protein